MMTLLEFENVRPEVRESLMQFMNLHTILSLQDLLEYKDEDLLEMEGFGMRLLVEVHKLRQINLASND